MYLYDYIFIIKLKLNDKNILYITVIQKYFCTTLYEYLKNTRHIFFPVNYYFAIIKKKICEYIRMNIYDTHTYTENVFLTTIKSLNEMKYSGFYNNPITRTATNNRIKCLFVL